MFDRGAVPSREPPSVIVLLRTLRRRGLAAAPGGRRRLRRLRLVSFRLDTPGGGRVRFARRGRPRLTALGGWPIGRVAVGLISIGYGLRARRRPRRRVPLVDLGGGRAHLSLGRAFSTRLRIGLGRDGAGRRPLRRPALLRRRAIPSNRPARDPRAAPASEAAPGVVPSSRVAPDPRAAPASADVRVTRALPGPEPPVAPSSRAGARDSAPRAPAGEPGCFPSSERA